MKFVCKKEYLEKALAYAAKAAGKHHALPIVKNIALIAEGGILSLVGTDLDVGVKTRVNAKVEGEGTVVLPPGLLAGFVYAVADGELITAQIEDGQNLRLSAQHSRALIKGYDPADFPPLPAKPSEAPTATVRAHTLKEAFSRLAVSIAQTEARPELGGVNMIFSAEEVRMATTDGFRLSEYVLPVKWQNTAGDEYPTVIIPAAAAAAMNQILSDAGERDLSVTVDEAQIFFSRGETSVVSRLVAGTYPDYKQIIPSSFAATAVLDRVALERAVRLAGTFSPAAGDMSLVVSPEEKVCLIDAASRERGSNSTRIELLSAEGERQEVFLNTKYLSDGLARCGTERVSLGLSGPTSPVLLKPADEEESPYLYLVMPIRKN